MKLKLYLSKMLKQRKLILALAVLWTIGIFVGCSLPGKEFPKVHLFDHFDKIIHFVFFFVFFFLWTAFFSFSKKSLFLFLVLSFFYGLGIEFYQRDFVAGRSFDIWDAFADSFGAFCSYIFIIYLFNKKN